MSNSASDLENASAAEHFDLRLRYKRSGKVHRDLKYFDSWLQATFEDTIDSPLPLAFTYKTFFLSHIALYPSAVTSDRFLSDDLERDLQLSVQLDGNALSCRQVFAQIMSVIRWQHYQFKVDTHKLMRELIPFYRRLCKITRSQELTYKSALPSETVLKVFRLHTIPGPQPERDMLILLMTWGVGCTPDELIKLSFSDFDVLGPVDWVYIRSNANGKPIKLEHMTALCMLDLISKNYELMGYDSDVLLNCRDGRAWRPLTEGDIHVILERHYRFAGALFGFDDYINPAGRPNPDLLKWEDALSTKALSTLTKEILAIHRQAHVDENQNDDWDAAVRKKSERHTHTEHRTSEDEQVDWDAAIMKSK